MISFSISFFKVFCYGSSVLFLLFVVLSMKFQLVLAALVGLASSVASAFGLWNYPPISSFDQNLSAAQHQTSYEQPRYLYTDANSSIPVVNATTLAVGAFYFGSIALGVLSVLNDAANAVAKHKAQKKVKKVKKKTYSFQPSFQPEEEELDEEYERYEQELRQYKESYAEYLQSYADWAEKYGQDPNPPPSPIHKR